MGETEKVRMENKEKKVFKKVSDHTPPSLRHTPKASDPTPPALRHAPKVLDHAPSGLRHAPLRETESQNGKATQESGEKKN